MIRKTPLFRLPDASGSSDGLQILDWLRPRLARGDEASGHPARAACPLAIVCARSADALRLDTELRWLAPDLRIALLPDWETLPYDPLSPHQDLVSDRIATLMALSNRSLDVVVVAATTAVQRLAPLDYLAGRSFSFRKGQRIDEKALRHQFTVAGYEHVSQVVRPGEYTVRGGLVDLYPTGAPMPLRLDLFGDEIEAIRVFDPDTQRSLHPVPEVNLLPGREFPFDEPACTAFRGRWREQFDGDPSRCPVYRDAGQGIAAPGIEYYLPLFFAQTATLFDYLGPDCRILLHGDLQDQLQRFEVEVQERYRFQKADLERPALPPEMLYLGHEAFFSATHALERLSLRQHSSTGQAPLLPTTSTDPDTSETGDTDPLEPGPRRQPAATRPPTVAINRRLTDPLGALRSTLEGPGPVAGTGECRLILAESAGRRETLHDLFQEHGLHLAAFKDWRQARAAGPGVYLGIGPMQEGFRLTDGSLLVLTEHELFPGLARQGGGHRNRQATTDLDLLVRDISELKPGDPVVHVRHGIGRYEGLVDMDLGEGQTEFLKLTYAAEASLYVPVAQLHLIGRYTGSSPDSAPLHSLGSGQWDKARRKAAASAHDSAADLLALYARRAAREGTSMPFHPSDYEAFVEGFGFEETPDQQAAIHAVIQDLVAPRPMDRLVCGDVGFGKTEVALRAAFVTAFAGRQVVVLTPTTLLAEQHHQTFADRFANWPVRIAELSRFRNPKEVRAAIAGLADGTIDIAIGTHKLLGKDVRFARLGLVIIDEEHRFGVRQKDALKALRAEVDVLTLTATPIPRTLAMSLEGIRDFSVIATAPQKRLAIKTFVRDEREATIREALLRELKRGGQVYFLHNEVETIGNRLDQLRTLVPEATVGVAHGQLPERELERVMRDFHQRRFNVLLCTTIIETGIDIPNANTIVIHRADRLGLAQLHQLRGRVGRSHHQAYAYLMIPGKDAITRDAGKRLDAIQQMEDLGSGFYLAMHDLEIRGAGEVLGEGQSGEMQEVGFQLYSDMLQRAVQALKRGEIPDLDGQSDSGPEIKLHVPALLPAEYCPDVHERLVLYKRLASCNAAEGLEQMREELIDRFGRLPVEAQALVDVHRLRILASAVGVTSVDAGPETIILQFTSPPRIEPLRILALAQSQRNARFAGQDRLRLEVHTETLEARVRQVRQWLLALAQPLPEQQARAVQQNFRPEHMSTQATRAAAPPPPPPPTSRPARHGARRSLSSIPVRIIPPRSRGR